MGVGGFELLFEGSWNLRGGKTPWFADSEGGESASMVVEDPEKVGQSCDRNMFHII